MTRWFPVGMIMTGLALLGAGSASAQGPTSVAAKIPFDFKVGKVTLPAGQYDVSYDGAEVPSALVIRSRDGHHQALILAEPVDTKPTTNARLVFEREASTYVLHEIFAPEARVGLELLGAQPGA